MVDRSARHTGPGTLVHRHSRYVWQRSVLQPFQHAGMAGFGQQHRQCTRATALAFACWGIDKLHGVYGWSMGGQIAYHWSALFPAAVERAIVCCGSARTAPHNKVFLSGLMAILEAAPEYLGKGRFSSEPGPANRAFARVYAGWGLSQDFYRAGLHRTAPGAPDLETFLVTDWENRFRLRSGGGPVCPSRRPAGAGRYQPGRPIRLRSGEGAWLALSRRACC